MTSKGTGLVRFAMKVALDHLGQVGPDLDDACRRAEALGFTLTRAAGHRATDAAAPGSRQRSIMLERGYIEIQEIADLTGPHPLAPAARRYFGNHIVAFGVDDAVAGRASLSAAGLPVGDVMEWSRPVLEDDASGEARFAFFASAYGPRDESFLCWVQHRTPELLRSPRLCRHDNGASALCSIMIGVDGDFESLVQRYRLCGATAVEATSGGAVVVYASGRVELRGRQELPALVRDRAWPAVPMIVGPLITVADLGLVGERVTAHGLASEAHRNRLYVDAGGAVGIYAFETT